MTNGKNEIVLLLFDKPLVARGDYVVHSCDSMEPMAESAKTYEWGSDSVRKVARGGG